MTHSSQSQSALQQLVEAYDLAPAAASKHPERIDVHVRSVAALEVFADALDKPIVSEDGDRFVVAHEVDGVPALFWSERAGEIKSTGCRIEIVKSQPDAVTPWWVWRFIASNGEQLARSSEVYASREGMEDSIVLTFGLANREQAKPGAVWYGHGAHTVTIEEVAG